MVTRWGMGRDPETNENGVSGRGTLSFLVASRSGSLPTDVQAAATRAIRAILDEAYEQATQTLLAEMDMLRRIAAYLFEHERIDGETFDALCAGEIKAPVTLEDWRAAASRPREWTEIPSFATDRRRAGRGDGNMPRVAAAAAVTRTNVEASASSRVRRPLTRAARSRFVMPLVRRRLQGVAAAAIRQAELLEPFRDAPTTEA
jgi:hypothetical protein